MNDFDEAREQLWREEQMDWENLKKEILEEQYQADYDLEFYD